MNIELSKLFSSPAKTRVLEILSRAKAPLHLRAIAEISEFNVSAVQKVLESLQKKKIVTSKKQSNRRIFSLVETRDETKLLSLILAAKRNLPKTRFKKRLGELIEFALTLTDEVYELREKKTPQIPTRKLFSDVIDLLNRNEITFVLSGDLVTSIYRNQVRNINSVTLNINHDSWPLFLSNLKEVKSSILKSFEAKEEESQITFVSKNRVNFCFKQEILEEMSEEVTTLFSDKTLRLQSYEDVILKNAQEFLVNPSARLLLDDIQAIFEAKHELDLPYMVCRMCELQLPIYKTALAFAPRVLKSTSMQIEREHGPFMQFKQIH